MNPKVTILAAAAATVAALGTAYAARGAEENDGAVLAQAKIGIAQAIAAAEQHVKGKAARAELENENGIPVYGVEVLEGAKATDVKIDARDGKVLSAQADRRDEGASEEREGDDEGANEGENAHR